MGVAFMKLNGTRKKAQYIFGRINSNENLSFYVSLVDADCIMSFGQRMLEGKSLFMCLNNDRNGVYQYTANFNGQIFKLSVLLKSRMAVLEEVGRA